jgi:hypothetical protein
LAHPASATSFAPAALGLLGLTPTAPSVAVGFAFVEEHLELIAKLKLHFEAKNICFEAKNVCFDVKNVCFDVKNVCFDVKNVCFDVKNVCFKVKN